MTWCRAVLAILTIVGLASCGDPAPASTDAGIDASTSTDARTDDAMPVDAAPVCGNGVVESGEACDDGNLILETCAYGEPSCTVCDPACALVAGATSVCGDGNVDADAGEQCDDSNTVSEHCSYGETSCTVCLVDCTLGAGETSYCGDGVLDGSEGEACDQGASNSDTAADACRTTCELPACGDGVTDSAEGCDAGDLRWLQIEAANVYACGILLDGTLRCWGESMYSGGASTAPPSGTFMHVAVEDNHACAVRTSGEVVCWGEELVGDGETMPPAGQFQKVEVGTAHSCGIRVDGTITCWGDPFLAARAPTGVFRDIVGYRYSACAISASNRTVCWSSTHTNTWWSDTVELDAGLSHICAVRTGGVISCYGDNTYGQTAPPAGTYKHVAAAYSHTCAVRSDDAIVCWGDVLNTIDPPNVALTQLRADLAYNCGLDAAGRIYCWGSDSFFGQTRPPGNNDFTPDACRTSCQAAHCGDGVLDESEECDDAVAADTGNGCSAQCLRNDVCGDSQVQDLYETCDDGNTVLESCAYGVEDCPACNETCQVAQGNRSFCGDGSLDTANGEQCDDARQDPMFVELEAGTAHVCGVRTDGRVSCFGYDAGGRLNAPAEKLHGISAGYDHSCGIRENGTVACWGGNSSGQSTPPGGLFKQVAAGDWFTCGIRVDGFLECWGTNTSGQASAPNGDGTKFVQVSAGPSHACAVTEAGAVRCWGYLASGYNVPPAGLFKWVAAGKQVTCGITITNKLDCWGYHYKGPYPISEPLGSFTKLSSGDSHTCGIRFDKHLVRFGSGNDYDYGVGFIDVMAGPSYCCGIRADNTVECWGSNIISPPINSDTAPNACRSTCQLAHCGDSVIDRGETCDDGNAVTEVCTYGARSCTVCDSACASTAGATSYCGDEVVDQSNAEECDDGDGTFTSIARGSDFACAVEEADGTLFCWGSGTSGQTAPPAGSFAAVAAGHAHACALDASGNIKCWGDNGSGQAPSSPSLVASQIAAGGKHTCAIRKSNGTIGCYGLTSFGISTPPTGPFLQISAGALHSCGVRTDGTVACWGDSTSGKTAAPFGSYVQVSAGFNRSCAVTSTGSITCWGDASQGDPPPGNFVEVSVGGEHSCALKTDGTIVCWGSDAEGALQAPTGTFTALAASIYSHDYSCAIRTNGELVCWGSPGVPEAEVPITNSDFRVDSCRLACFLPTCGDGVIDSGEQCDDGGTMPGDGCSQACTIE